MRRSLLLEMKKRIFSFGFFLCKFSKVNNGSDKIQAVHDKKKMFRKTPRI